MADAMTNAPFIDLSDHAASTLLKRAEKIKKTQYEKIYHWNFKTKSLSKENYTTPIPDKDIKEIKSYKSKFIYIFYINSLFTHSDLFKEFLDNKKKNDLSFCAASTERTTNTLYVGQSSSILSRVKEHLGHGAQRTYSMQLAHWARPLNLDLTITCARYPGDTDAQALQDLEDTLWDTLLPLLGKRGGR